MRSLHTLVLAATVFSSLTITALARDAVKSGTKKQDLIPLPYPQANAGVGTMRWGADPAKPATAQLPANLSFSKAFLDSIPKQAVAWENQKKIRDFSTSVTAKPGPQLLEAIQVGSLTGTAGLDYDSVKCLKWGNLEESSVDLQSLSEALVRGWFNLPGRAMHAEALSKVRLDMAKYPQRPWIVVRSLAANGLEYGVSRELGLKLSAAASTPVYGSASGGIGFAMKNDRTLVVNQPMIIGYDVAQLNAVEPPLPFLGSSQNIPSVSTYNFSWVLRESGKKITVNVDPFVLREQDKRLAAEASLPKPVVENLNQQIQQAPPAKLALIAECKPRVIRKPEENKWRRLDEGAMFTSGDIVRLRVVLDEPAYIYVLARDSSKQAAVLFPQVAGEALSRGEDKQIAKKEWIFPQDVINEEGLTYGNDSTGTESFVVIASKTKQESLAGAMAAFAKAARDQVAKAATPVTTAAAPAATRDALLGFHDIVRLPAGFATTTNTPVTATAAAVSAVAPAPTTETFFTGLNSATVLTVNLNLVATK